MKNVKALIAVICLITGVNSAIAQTVGISADPGNTANSKAILDLDGVFGTDYRGMLLPRMTDAQKATYGGTLVAADEGMTIYNSTSDRYEYWDGTQWRILATASSGANDYIQNQNALDQGASFRINGWGETYGLKINSGDGEKLQFTNSGSNGSKIRHTSGWALDYHAGPGNSSTTGSHRFYTTSGNTYRERLAIEGTGRVSIRQDLGNDPAFAGLESPETASGRAQLVLSSSYSDLVIASREGNDNHGSTLTFATYNPGNANDYRKFVVNQGNWGARRGYLDFGYSDAGGRTNPHANINATDNVMTLDGFNKRVGIGTNTPGNKLHVDYSNEGTNRSTASITGPGNAQWGNVLTLRTTGAGTDGAAVVFRSKDSKNWIAGGESTGDVPGFQIREDGGDGQFGSGFGTVRMHVEPGGNVGIGTTSPAYDLDVSGNTRTTGDFFGNIHVDDTRDVNEQPTVYNNEVAFDFKRRTTIGVPGSGTYSGNMTIAPWGDNSGDASHQINFNEGGLYWRQGQPQAGSWGGWDRIVTESALGSLSGSGNWIPNNGSGDWQIASNSNATGYQQSTLELRETNFAGAGQQPPRLGFHWGGVVASQIAVESSGRISVRDNPGTGYENMIARDLFADREIYVNNWVRHNDNDGTYWSNNGWHIYPNSDQDMNIRSGNTGGGSLRLMNSTAVRGYLHWTSSEQGWLNSARQWQIKTRNGDGLSPNLYFDEEGNENWTGNPGDDEGKIEYHSNRFYIASGANSSEIARFRRSGSDVGFIANGGDAYFPIFRDWNDGGYYLDPNSTSREAGRIRGGTLHGPNVGWGDYLSVGASGREWIDNADVASVATTNGNLHLDASSGHGSYINWYDGDFLYIGRGNNSARALMNGNGLYLYDGWLRPHGNNGLYFQDGGSGITRVQADGGNYGSVSTYGAVGGWEGYAIDGRYTFMGQNNGQEWGIYNDVDNIWAILYNRLATNNGFRFFNSWSGALNMRIQHTNGGNYASYDGDSNWDFYSDRRLKEDIENEDNILERLLKMDVVNYNFIDQGRTETEQEKGIIEYARKEKEIGFIAQEVEKYFPSLVSEAEDDRFDFKVKALGYSSFGVLAIGGIKELKEEKDKEIAALRNQIEGLQTGNSASTEVQELKAEVDELKQLVKALMENQK